MTFAKILCPTDFSDASKRAVEHAARLATEHKTELVLVHAWYVPPMMYSGEYVFPPPALEEMADAAQHMLDGAVGEAKGMAPNAKSVSGVLIAGVPWSSIVEQLEALGCDLCVMATHGRTGITRVLLGSVAEKVIRHAKTTVLTIRPDHEVKPIRHVLCPTDFSESAEYALERALELVKPGGKITLLHVIEVPVAYAGEVRIADFARDLDKRAADALDREAKRVAGRGYDVDTRSRLGYPGQQTLHAIDDDPTIDLVAMGSHGRTGIRRALLGSVAEKVVRHARCPVLVTRKRM
jgi:nucleotide-binding universal stress UspA family protein